MITTSHVLACAIGALSGGYVVWLMFPRPLSRRRLERLGFRLCPLCEGAGAINDITNSHGTPYLAPLEPVLDRRATPRTQDPIVEALHDVPPPGGGAA